MKQKIHKEYDHKQIELKWQSKWDEVSLYSPDIESAKKPYFNLMMFPYPSAEGMHVGNMYAFTGADIYGRFKRMQGYDVLEPIGLDGFGIHSENYALKVGTHPMDQAEKSEANFYRQLRATGNSFDWKRTVETYNPSYYRWTQWLFLQMFKNGLAYRKKASVNYCPSCKTVLADEQVIKGLCERCSSSVEKRELEQWFFRITHYAEKLLSNIEQLDWSEKVKVAQRNWIGKSTGAKVKFKVPSQNAILEVFTTRPDTLYGVTFMVISPEHPLVATIINDKSHISDEKKQEIKAYVKKANNKSEEDRINEKMDKTGIYSGVNATNLINGAEIPIWIADYVLMNYGTGAIMAVPAHDERDHDFAKKYDLPIVPVIESMDKAKKIDVLKEPYTGEGRLINSAGWDDYYVPAAMQRIIKDIEHRGIGTAEDTYHLRDWLISRQRYWGAPIPMIYCEACAENGKSYLSENNIEAQWDHAGWFPVPDDELPVMLPRIDDYKPLGTGKAPLASHPEFYNTSCPSCGGNAIRETDVSDTFLDSAWYFLRYPSTDIENSAFDTVRTKKWLPVDMYIGGAEHSVLHLLYSRFVTMFLADLKLINFDEPYKRFFAHGLLIKEGVKMSKSKGNVIVPDQYIAKYGADTLRSYLMFLGPFSQGGDFYDTGIEGMNRFLKRVWRLFSDTMRIKEEDATDKKALAMLHKTIAKVTDDISLLHYNTALAALMEYYNFLSEHSEVSRTEAITFIKLLAPFAPHMTEELYQELKGFASYESIHTSSWPIPDTSFIVEDTVTIAIQVNGKLRGTLEVTVTDASDQSTIQELSEKEENAKRYLVGKSVQKVIYVPNRLINFVVR